MRRLLAQSHDHLHHAAVLQPSQAQHATQCSTAEAVIDASGFVLRLCLMLPLLDLAVCDCTAAFELAVLASGAILACRTFPCPSSLLGVTELHCHQSSSCSGRADDELLASTCSRKVRDLLMCLASRAVAPLAPVLAKRSEPARSTMFSLDLYASPSASHSLGLAAPLVLLTLALAYAKMSDQGLPLICCHQQGVTLLGGGTVGARRRPAHLP